MGKNTLAFSPFLPLVPHPDIRWVDLGVCILQALGVNAPIPSPYQRKQEQGRGRNRAGATGPGPRLPSRLDASVVEGPNYMTAPGSSSGVTVCFQIISSPPVLVPSFPPASISQMSPEVFCSSWVILLSGDGKGGETAGPLHHLVITLLPW